MPRAKEDTPTNHRVVISFCLDLHMWNSGYGANPWAAERKKCRDFLEDALKNWTDGPERCRVFDNAVKCLVRAALYEDTTHEWQLKRRGVK